MAALASPATARALAKTVQQTGSVAAVRSFATEGTLTISIPIASEVIEAIAIRTAAIILQTGIAGITTPWMNRRQAAEYLHLPLSRLEKDRSIPCHRDNGRVLYNRAELDAYFLSLGS